MVCMQAAEIMRAHANFGLQSKAEHVPRAPEHQYEACRGVAEVTLVFPTSTMQDCYLVKDIWRSVYDFELFRKASTFASSAVMTKVSF